MTREEAKEFYPILQDYAEGKVIECRTKPSALEGTDVPNDWAEMKEIEYWNNTEYRIKPDSKAKAKYRPFANVEECWQEMLKHQPFGWVKNNNLYRNILETSDGAIFYHHFLGRCLCFLLIRLRKNSPLLMGHPSV